MTIEASTVTESVSHWMGAGRKPELNQSAAVANREVAFLSRLRQGDEEVFDELITRHHSALIRMAMGYVADREVAEEVVQDTWMVVIEGVGRFEGRSSLRTWIFGIMIHKAKDRGVREKRHTTFSSFESPMTMPMKRSIHLGFTNPVNGPAAGPSRLSPGMIRHRKSSWRPSRRSLPCIGRSRRCREP